jgi:succinyl-CoA synthetase alpha subunit
MEERVAEYVTRVGTRLKIVAFVAGRFTDAMQGIRFGHAAAIVEGTRGSPQQKIRLLRDAGIGVAHRLSEIPSLLTSVSGGVKSGPVH